MVASSNTDEFSKGESAKGAVDTTQRLAALRAEMEKNGLSAYIVPTEDAHQVGCFCLAVR
jgi:hypothetical protein